MAEGWQPNMEELNQVAQMLQALRDPTRPDHRTAVQSLDSYINNEIFIQNILHLFVRGHQYETMGLTIDIRQLAGMVVKNYIVPKILHLPPGIQHTIKHELLAGLIDSNAEIQNVAGILFGRFTEAFPINVWTDVIPHILTMLDLSSHGQVHVADGGLKAVKRICEDSCEKLCMDTEGKPLQRLVPLLIDLLKAPDAHIRLQALQSLNAMLYLISPPGYHRSSSDEDMSSSSSGSSSTKRPESGAAPLLLHMNNFLNGIASLAADPTADVRCAVCQSLVLLASFNVSVLEKAFPSICAFMLQAVLDPEETVAIEACEFWAVISQSTDTQAAMSPHLQVLVPSLISRLRLNVEQLQQERADEEAEASGEKRLDIKPVHHRGEDQRADSDSDQEEVASRWTLRKEAALLLDNIAVAFDEKMVLSHALPAIQECLSQTVDVWRKEGGLLALGALSTGSMDSMLEYLPQLFPFLIQSLQDGEQEVRSIACWVISRYCGWLFADDNDSGEHLFALTMDSLISTLTDKFPRVQAAACSAMCMLIEVAGEHSFPFVQKLLAAFQHCYGHYGVKSTMLLVDTIGTLADNLGDSLADPQLAPLFLPFLIQKFDEIEDTDYLLFPLLECLTSVTPAVGTEIAPYATNLLGRCLRIINFTLTSNAAAEHGAADIDEVPVKDFAICGLDVLSGLCEGLGQHFKSLVQETKSEDAVLSLLFMCLRDPLPEVRQSGFSLAGEVCKSAPGVLPENAQQELLTVAISNLDVDFPLVSNNASWTIGEIAVMSGGAAMAPYLGRIMTPIIQMLSNRNQLPLNLKQNLAITIGRLGVTNTQQMAEILPEILVDFCACLKVTPQSEERDHAFRGLIAILHANPGILGGSANAVPALYMACASWDDPPEEDILSGISSILQSIKNSNEAAWRQMTSTFGDEYNIKVRDIFQLR